MRLFRLQECGCLAWSPVSMQFVLATSSANITETFASETSLSVYSLDTDFITPIRELSWPFAAEFTGLLWSTNDNIIAGFDDGSLSIGLWNDMGNAVRIQAHSAAVSALSCSVDYSLPLLATGSASGEVSFWDLNTRALWHAIKSREGATAHNGGITQISWNHKVPRICCTASQDGSVSIWDMDKKGGLMNLRGDDAPLVSAIFSSEIATVVFTITINGLVSMWDLRQKTHPVATHALQLPNTVKPEYLFLYQCEKTFLCAPTDDGKCYFFLPGQTNLTLIGSSDEFGAHLNLSPLCPSYLLLQKHDSASFSSETEGHYIPSLIPLTMLSSVISSLPSPTLPHPLPLFTDDCPEDVPDNYEFMPKSTVHINLHNVMLAGSQKQDADGSFKVVQVHDASSILSQIEQVLSLPAESHSCALPSHIDLPLQSPDKIFRAFLSAGSDQIHSWLTGNESSPKIKLATQAPVRPQSDGKDFFDDIPNSSSEYLPEGDICEPQSTKADKFGSYYPFLYDNNLHSAAAHAANTGDFGLAFYIAIHQNDKGLLDSISESFQKASNSNFVKAVSEATTNYMAILNYLPADQWFQRLKIAAAYGGDAAIKDAAVALLQISGNFSPALLTALTLLADRASEAFELAASTSSLLDILTMAILCTSRGVSVTSGSSFRTIDGLITIVVSQGDEKLASALRDKFTISSQSLQKKTHTAAADPTASKVSSIPEPKDSMNLGAGAAKQGRRSRMPTGTNAKVMTPASMMPQSGGMPAFFDAAPPMSQQHPQQMQQMQQMQQPLVIPAQSPAPIIPKIQPMAPSASSIIPTSVLPVPIPDYAAQQVQAPVLSMHQARPMIPAPNAGFQPLELNAAMTPSITAPAPPAADGTVSRDIVQVTTTTAPQGRAARRQPSQMLTSGSPLSVINAIATNSSANAERLKALILRYAEVDQMTFAKYYTKLGDCVIHLAEQGLLSADTTSVLGRYIAGLEMGNRRAADEAIRSMAARKPRLYSEELSAWAASLKLVAQALGK